MSLKNCIHLVRQQLHINKKALNFKVAQLYPKDQKLAVIIRKKQTHRDLAKYLHAECYSPVKSTWEEAIKKDHFLRGRDSLHNCYKNIYCQVQQRSKATFIKKDRIFKVQRISKPQEWTPSHRHQHQIKNHTKWHT